MTQSKKKSLTDAELKIEIRKLWNEGERGKTHLYELLRTKIKIEKKRCLKMYNEVEKEATQETLQAQSDTIIEETKEAVKQGLKSKFERVMILQREVDKILQELDANVTTDYVAYQGYATRVVKEISVTDRAYMRKTLKDLQAEISKIEGDYADTNVKHSGEVIQRLIIEDAQNCEPLNESYSSIQS